MTDTQARIRFLDDRTEQVVTIRDTHDVLEDDDNIFFYGMSRRELVEAKENGWTIENEWEVLEVL